MTHQLALDAATLLKKVLLSPDEDHEYHIVRVEQTGTILDIFAYVPDELGQPELIQFQTELNGYIRA